MAVYKLYEVGHIYIYMCRGTFDVLFDSVTLY